MGIEQRVISACIRIGSDADSLAAQLTRYGAEGWRVRQISTAIHRTGGAIFASPDAYYLNQLFMILDRGPNHCEYRCELVIRSNMTQDTEAMNVLIGKHAGDGFQLVHLAHISSIGPREGRATPGTIAHLLVFQKELAE